MTKPKVSKHHRKPKSLGGDDSNRNLSYIAIHKHRAWHLLFYNMTPEEIAEEINRHYLDPDYRMVARRLKCKSWN